MPTDEPRRENERILTLSEYPVEKPDIAVTPEMAREKDAARFDTAKKRSQLMILKSIKKTGWWWPS